MSHCLADRAIFNRHLAHYDYVIVEYKHETFILAENMRWVSAEDVSRRARE